MKDKYDVIIIGAGPSGAGCAKLLVEKGLKVLVIEEKKLPRFKCCSGMYSIRALDLIKKNFYEEIPVNFWCKNKELMTCISKSGDRFFSINYKFFNIKRELVDFWLINKSKAEIFDSCMFLRIISEDMNIITIECMFNNKKIKLSCKYLIGADGARSRLRKTIDNRYDMSNSGYAYQIVYKGDFKNIDNKFFHVIVNKDYSEYFASFHIKEDLLYVAADVPLFNNWFLFLKGKYQFDVKEIRKEACYTEIFKNKESLFFGRKNILLTGEASGLISVFSEGIPSAIVSGIEAAKSIYDHETQYRDQSVIDIYNNNIKYEVDFIEKAWKETKLY